MLLRVADDRVAEAYRDQGGEALCSFSVASPVNRKNL
jgi:hypothetical protein